jgi:ribosomal protein S18 acetylase RimI-like enzyme
MGYNHLRQLRPGDPALSEVLALIRTEFAYMDGVVDPPSSMHALTVEALATTGNEVWAIGHPVIACVVLTPKPPVLYVGKLAVAAESRRKGHARTLIDHATLRARALGLGALELQVRVELEGNQRAFTALGFVEVGRTAHPGYKRATSVTMRRGV